MGIFGRKPGKADSLEPHEAVLSLLFLAMTSDGLVQTEERKRLRQILQRVRLFHRLDPEDLERARSRFRLLRAEYGRKRLLDHAARFVAPEARAATYALVLELVLADGVIKDTEAEYAEKVRRALRLPEQDARKIFHTLQTGCVLTNVSEGGLTFAPADKE
ncbi:MAG: tellurite resistance TerB family protein [Armatimonadetes bacterium]|nr:tellurite resistance TerB family protein [Armatimonadota bacterium]